MAREMYEDAVVAKETDSDAKTWGMICPVASFAGYVIPFGNIVGPLIAWQIKKDGSAFVDHHGRESLNFQITVTIAFFVFLLLCLVLVGFFLLALLGIVDLVLVIVAAVRASNGEYYRYPLTIRLIK